MFYQVVVYKCLIGAITAKTVAIVEIFPLRVHCALVLLMQTFKLTLNLSFSHWFKLYLCQDLFLSVSSFFTWSVLLLY